MSDIVERLRDSASNPAIWKLTQEAADELERGRAYIDHLRAELAAERDEVFRLQESHSRVCADLAAMKALLRDADAELTSWMYHGHGSKTSGYGSAPLLNRIRAALGEKP